MPLKDGVEVIKEIRQFIDTQSCIHAIKHPVYMIATAYYSDHFMKSAERSGADFCIEKPISID